MTGRTGGPRRLLAAVLAAGVFLLTASAGAALGGVTVTVLDSYQADYGVTIPFTRSPRTTDYTFSLYEGGSAAGTPAVSAKVEMTAAQGDVYLPLAYDITEPQSYTLKIEARPLADRIGTDTAAAREFPFTTKPTCGCASGTAGAFYRGSGSAADPFYVGSQQQLAHVGAHGAANIYQDRDIALSGNWTPIGSTTNFTGNYDGGGHYVYNLYFDAPDLMPGGLFGNAVGASISRLGVVCDTTRASRGYRTGTIAGHVNACTISQCFGSLYASPNARDNDTSPIGCLVGEAVDTTFTDCSATGSIVSGNGYAGGIIGFTRNTVNLIRCQSYSNMASGVSKGGLVGTIANGTVAANSCYWLTPNLPYSVVGNSQGSYSAANGTAYRTDAQFKSGAVFSGWSTATWNFRAGSIPSLKIFG